MPTRKRPASRPAAVLSAAHTTFDASAFSTEAASVTAEYLAGKRRFSSSVVAAGRHRRLLGPARATAEEAEADQAVLCALALLESEGEETAAAWRAGDRNDRDASRVAAKARQKRTAKQSRTSGSAKVVSACRRWRLRGKQAASRLTTPRLPKNAIQQPVCLSTGQVTMEESAVLPVVMRTDALASALGLPRKAVSVSEASTSLATNTPPRIETSSTFCVDASPVTVNRTCNGQTNDEFSKLVRTKVNDALIARAPVLSAQKHELEDIAHEIALAFAAADIEKPTQQLRALLFNLRDSRNPDFIRDVASRAISPAQLPLMATEDMASAEKRSQRIALLDKSIRENTLAASSGWKATRARR